MIHHPLMAYFDENEHLWLPIQAFGDHKPPKGIEVTGHTITAPNGAGLAQAATFFNFTRYMHDINRMTNMAVWGALGEGGEDGPNPTS